MNKEYTFKNSMEVSKTSTGKFAYSIKVYSDDEKEMDTKMRKLIGQANIIINDAMVGMEMGGAR